MLHAAMRDGQVPTEGVKVCEFFASVGLGHASVGAVRGKVVQGGSVRALVARVCTRVSHLHAGESQGLHALDR